MERDPVIAVIVGSRDPATYLNYLYLSLSFSLPLPRILLSREFHFCISRLDASARSLDFSTRRFRRVYQSPAGVDWFSANTTGVKPGMFVIIVDRVARRLPSEFAKRKLR